MVLQRVFADGYFARETQTHQGRHDQPQPVGRELGCHLSIEKARCRIAMHEKHRVAGPDLEHVNLDAGLHLDEVAFIIVGDVLGGIVRKRKGFERARVQGDGPLALRGHQLAAARDGNHDADSGDGENAQGYQDGFFHGFTLPRAFLQRAERSTL